MQRLMIRFLNDGEYFREIDEERFYYLSEAEKVVSKIREQLKKQNRNVQSKKIECWLDEEKITVDFILNSKATIQEQLVMALGTERHANKLKQYVAEERQLFLNKEFEVFSIRFNQVFGSLRTKPFPVLLNIKELKKLFDEIYGHVTASFYSELEEIMNAIKTTIETIIPLAKHGKVQVWLNIDVNFQSFIKYVAACYQSVSKKRIEALCSRFRPYQDIQLYLFKDFAFSCGFSRAYEYHIELNEAIIKKYDDMLFQGFALKTDEMVESLVLSSVISKYQKMIDEKFSEKTGGGKHDNWG